MASDLVVRLDEARLVVLSLARPFGKAQGQAGHRQCHDDDSLRPGSMTPFNQVKSSRHAVSPASSWQGA